MLEPDRMMVGKVGETMVRNQAYGSLGGCIARNGYPPIH